MEWLGEAIDLVTAGILLVAIYLAAACIFLAQPPAMPRRLGEEALPRGSQLRKTGGTPAELGFRHGSSRKFAILLWAEQLGNLMRSMDPIAALPLD